MRARFLSVLSLAVLGVAWTTPRNARAQDTSAVEAAIPGVALTLDGTLQPRFTYGRIAAPGADDGDGVRERFGLGVRRARLRFEATLSERSGAYFQLGAADPSVQLFDAILFFDATDALRVRMGRFPSAQPRAFQGTSHRRIDLVDRTVIAQRWGNTTLANDGRDFGLDVLYETDRATVQAGLYNGIGDWGRALGNLRTDIAEDPTGGTDTPGLAPSVYGAWRPATLSGVELGGFAGYNAARSPVTRPSSALAPASVPADQGRAYASYSGHLYWGAEPGSQPVRLKADLIGTRFETLSARTAELEQHALGVAFTGAVGLFGQAAELLARVDRYDPTTRQDGDTENYLAAGASVSLSALYDRAYQRQRLTLVYSARTDAPDDPHLVVLQAQLAF